MNKDHLLSLSNILISVLLGAALAFFLNISLIIRYVLRDNQESYQKLYYDTLRRGQDLFIFPEDGSVVATITTFILLSIAFSAGFILLNFIFSEIKSFLTEVKVDVSYVHPKNDSNVSRIKSSAWHLAYPIGVVTLTIAWIAISFSAFMPYSSNSLLIALYGDTTPLVTTLNIFISILVMALMVAGAIVLSKLIKPISKYIW